MVEKKLLGVIAVATFGFTFTVSAIADQIIVVSFGGAYADAQIEAYHKSWMAQTGHTVGAEVYNGGLAEIRSQVESGNVTWDVVDVITSDAIRGCDEGLLKRIDPNDLPAGADGTPPHEDFIDGTLYDCAVGISVWSAVYAYDTTKFSEGPRTAADFFDLERFPGSRGLRKRAEFNLEFALMADGVPPSDVYEVLSTSEGVDRAFAKLDAIKSNTVWWESGAQAPQLLADGEVSMTTAWNGRIFNAIVKEKQPFQIVWDGQIWDLDLWVIPKGTPQKKLAMEFVKHATSTEALARQASFISYGPVRKSSAPLVGNYHGTDIDMAPHMPTHPDNMKNALRLGADFWASYKDELELRFASWLSK